MSEHPGAPIGVVVVHGVGDPKPGEALDTLVESLCGRSSSLSIEATSRRVLTGSRYERKDDYVGRGLGGVNDEQIPGTAHEGYWTDPSVLEEHERLIGL